MTHDYQDMTTPSQDASQPRAAQDAEEAADVPPPADDASTVDVTEDTFEQEQGTSTT